MAELHVFFGPTVVDGRSEELHTTGNSCDSDTAPGDRDVAGMISLRASATVTKLCIRAVIFAASILKDHAVAPSYIDVAHVIPTGFLAPMPQLGILFPGPPCVVDVSGSGSKKNGSVCVDRNLAGRGISRVVRISAMIA